MVTLLCPMDQSSCTALEALEIPEGPWKPGKSDDFTTKQAKKLLQHLETCAPCYIRSAHECLTHQSPWPDTWLAGTIPATFLNTKTNFNKARPFLSDVGKPVPKAINGPEQQ